MIQIDGFLGAIGLADVVQLLGELHETGQLRLIGSGSTGQLAFDQGVLVDAVYGEQRGLEALTSCMLIQDDAEFRFTRGESPRERTLRLSSGELRTHLAQISSSPSASSSLLRQLEGVLHLADRDGLDPAERLVLPRSALRLLPMIDGRRTVRDVLEARPLVSALRDLGQLIEQGLIVVDMPPPAAVAAAPDLDVARAAVPELNGAPAAVDVLDKSAEPANGHVPQQAPEVQPAANGVCPRLGYADDRDRHYSRPTALHRCYALGVAEVVTAQAQHELCLGAGHNVCARFLGVGLLPVAANGAAIPPVAAVVQPTRVSAPATSPANEPAARVSARVTSLANAPAVQEGMSAPSRRAATAARGVSARGGVAAGARFSPSSATATSAAAGRRPSLRGVPRRVLLVVGLVILLLAVLILAVGQLMPALNGLVQPAPLLVVPSVRNPSASDLGPAGTTAAPLQAEGEAAAGQPASEAGLSAPIEPPAPAVTSIPVPTLEVTAVVRPPLPFNVDFTTAPAAGWLDHPPYAVWTDGAYRVAAPDAERFTAVGAPLRAAASDVVVSATFRKIGGPPGGGYGLMLRTRADAPLDGVSQVFHGYVLEVGDRGEVGIWRRDGDEWVDLVSWTPSNAVHPEEATNEVEARASGEVLSLTVNGVEVARATDARLGDGGVGVFVGGDDNQAAVERFSVEAPR